MCAQALATVSNAYVSKILYATALDVQGSSDAKQRGLLFSQANASIFFYVFKHTFDAMEQVFSRTLETVFFVPAIAPTLQAALSSVASVAQSTERELLEQIVESYKRALSDRQQASDLKAQIDRVRSDPAQL